MRAAVLYGKEDVRLESVPERALAPGEVRVDIRAALTCGTDLKVFKRGYHARMLRPPCTFGHEFAGVLSEVTPEAIGWSVGDRVVAANSAPCGHCPSCQRCQEQLCDDLLFLNGAYAESIAVPARIVEKNLLRVRSSTEFADAALVEPLACVVQGVHDLALQPGERVLVIGAGPIGLMFVALARAAHCDVTLAGRGELRLKKGWRLGATAIVDVAGKEDLVGAIREGAPSSGAFDVVIECVGQPAVWEAAVVLVRKGGRVNFFGGCPSGATVTFDTTLLHYSALTLLASFHHTPRTIRRALLHIEAGTIRAADFVDGLTALSELPSLFRAMTAGNRAVKTLINVRG